MDCELPVDLDDLVAHDRHEERQEKQLIQAAVSLGRKYMFDEAHGLKVGALATSLFDQLLDLHHLSADDRLVLLAAAILHDIGTYISQRAHHKHSLYIISGSELPGLSAAQILLAANVARYHRKSFRSPGTEPSWPCRPRTGRRSRHWLESCGSRTRWIGSSYSSSRRWRRASRAAR